MAAISNNNRYTRLIRQPIASALRSRGFRANGNSFVCDDGSVAQVIGIQKNTQSTAETVIVTVNCGVFLWCLEKLHWTWIKRPDVSVCHWSERIGYLIGDNQDTWWKVSSSVEAEEIGKFLASRIVDACLPAMSEVASETGMRALWASGKGPGLTARAIAKYLEVLDEHLAAKASDLAA